MPRINHLIFLSTALAAVLAIAADRPDRGVADFDADSYGKWQATGDAFRPAPVRGPLAGQHPVTGFLGDRLVNTFRNGDASTGTLTSLEFTTDREYLAFRIGGGAHAETCFQLLVDGEVVASASGINDERLTRSDFDLTEQPQLFASNLKR